MWVCVYIHCYIIHCIKQVFANLTVACTECSLMLKGYAFAFDDFVKQNVVLLCARLIVKSCFDSTWRHMFVEPKFMHNVQPMIIVCVPMLMICITRTVQNNSILGDVFYFNFAYIFLIIIFLMFNYFFVLYNNYLFHLKNIIIIILQLQITTP